MENVEQSKHFSCMEFLKKAKANGSSSSALNVLTMEGNCGGHSPLIG